MLTVVALIVLQTVSGVISTPAWERMPTAEELRQALARTELPAEATVQLLCVLDEARVPTQCLVESSARPASPEDQAALELASRFRHAATLDDGREVKSGDRVRFTIRLTSPE